jgi:hypothetical protein
MQTTSTLFSRMTGNFSFTTFSLTAAVLLGPLLSPAHGRSDGDTPAKIRQAGRLPGGAAYQSLVRTKYRQLSTRPGNAIAANASAGNALVEVGEAPAGFGKGFIWDRKDDEILLVAFLNAADDLGISIAGVTRSDMIEIGSASGVASFSKDTGNPTASSIVGLVAVGADAALGATGKGAFVPAVNSAEAIVKDLFKATNARTMRRDPYGVDPGSGLKAREEGGFLVCLPEAGGPFYSGDSSHSARWIKADGTRTPEHMPNHIPVYQAFFPLRGDNTQNTRQITADGEIYVVPWDWKFDDNAGYYKVFIHIKKGLPIVDGPILRERGASRPRAAVPSDRPGPAETR